MKRPIGEWPYPRGERVAFQIVDPASLALIFEGPVGVEADCCLFWPIEEFLDDGVLAGGAIQPMEPPFAHVAEAAFFVRPRARSYVPDLYYAARDMIRMAVYRREYLRVQCHVATDDRLQVAWAERLGFVDEGKLLRMGPDGTDMSIMRWEG